MDDNLEGFTPDPGDEQPSEEGRSEQDYVTRTAFSTELSTLKDELLRAIQSTKDKRIGKLEEQLQAHAEALNSQGVTLTAGDMELLRQEMIQRAIRQRLDTDEDDIEVAPSAPKPSPEAIRQVRLKAAELTAQYKFEIEEGDPELVRLNRLKTTDPDIYMEALTQEYALKAKRIGKSPVQEPQGDKDRVITAGKESDQSLKSQYLKDIMSVPPGSEAALQIRRQYRAKGLDV